MTSTLTVLKRNWSVLFLFGFIAWICMPAFAQSGSDPAPADKVVQTEKPIQIKISDKKVRAIKDAAKLKKATAFLYTVSEAKADQFSFTMTLKDGSQRVRHMSVGNAKDPIKKAVVGKWKAYTLKGYEALKKSRAEAKKQPEEPPTTITVYSDNSYTTVTHVWEKKVSKPRTTTLYDWFMKFSPILLLLIVVAIVIGRLPKVELGHSAAFRRRRVMNWLPMGLTYAFLYMGRYNLKVAQGAFGDIMTLSDFSFIFLAGTVTYGLSFLINGPLTDRIGGKKAILIGAAGSAVCNLGMGLLTYYGYTGDIRTTFSLLYAANMYFQSFGAVAIVRVNAPWFHVNERGVFGAIFGILISLGIYFAFDWGYLIVSNFNTEWIFFVPSILLVTFWVLVFFVVRNTPGEAGFKDFDTADASSGDDGPQMGAKDVFKKMLTNPVILTIACIEFCSGFFRQAIMQYYPAFAEATNSTGSYVYQNWGLLLCCAGILGGVFAGIVSDRIFQSRRGPVAAVLYGAMLVGAVAACFLVAGPFIGWTVIFMSMCVIGVHGMLSGTASMDFGGRKNVGVAVGIIDGFVYLGTGFMALIYAWLLPETEFQSFEFGLGSFREGIPMDPSQWQIWPITLIPVAIVGMLLARRVWHAKPKGKSAAH